MVRERVTARVRQTPRWVAVLTLTLTVVAPGAARPAADEVTVKTLADDELRGRVRSLSLADGLILDTDNDSAGVTVPADEIVRLTVTRGKASAVPTVSDAAESAGLRVEVQLVDGDRLFGRPLSATDAAERGAAEERVRLETDLLGVVDIPLSLIERWVSVAGTPRGIRRSIAGESEGRRAAEETSPSAAVRPSAVDDGLTLSNGDVVRGVLLGIDAQGVRFETEGTALAVPHAQVVAIDLVPEARRWQQALRARVTLADRSEVATDALIGTSAQLTLTLFGDTSRQVRWERVTRVEVSGGQWLWLTEIEPVSVQQTPMLTVSWPYARDTNVRGGPLRVAHRVFEHGIGAHSESALLYDLAGAYTALVTHLGLDDSAGPLADVTAEIRVDDQVRYRREHLRAGELEGPVRVDVRGAARLELRVLFGDHAAIQDRFDWCDTGLIRSASAGSRSAGTP